MNRKIIPHNTLHLLLCLLLFSIGYSQPSRSQSYSTQLEHLFKLHDTTEVVVDEYIDKFYWTLYATPTVFIDTVVITEPQLVTCRPSPIVGWDSVIHLIKYPQNARLVGLSGKLVLKATIDKSGILQAVAVIESQAEIFDGVAKDALRRTRYNPARVDTPVDCEALVAFSFVLKRKVNPEIDSIIVDRSGCLGFCPSYTIALDKNGGVIYDGHAYVEKKGKWKAVMKPSEFLGLTSLIYAMRFFSMNESYPTGWTDLSWITITVKSQHLVKRVSSDFYLPLREFSTLVDLLTEKTNWERVGE
jgi:TonB family protein